MTRDDLNSIYYINKELTMWEKELDDLREQSMMRSKEITGMPFANTNETGDPVAELASRLMDVELIILGKKKELEIKRAEIMTFIMSIDDSVMRQIVKYRCVDLKRWDDIGDLIGFDRTSCSKKFKEFLSKI